MFVGATAKLAIRKRLFGVGGTGVAGETSNGAGATAPPEPPVVPVTPVAGDALLSIDERFALRTTTLRSSGDATFLD